MRRLDPPRSRNAAALDATERAADRRFAGRRHHETSGTSDIVPSRQLVDAGAPRASVIGGAGSPQPTAETPNFGGFAYLGVSATELVLVKGKRGMVGLKMTDDVVARVPRSDVVSVDLGEGKLASPLTITFGNGGQWELEVARASRGAAERVLTELGG